MVAHAIQGYTIRFLCVLPVRRLHVRIYLYSYANWQWHYVCGYAEDVVDAITRRLPWLNECDVCDWDCVCVGVYLCVMCVSNGAGKMGDYAD